MNAQAPQNATGKQWEYYTDMPVGEILRRARVHYGQTLNDVESSLRIRASQLGSLEDGKLEDLPGRVYAIGFVRAYSEYLGLDGDKMVHLFKIQSVGNKARPELNFPVGASESKLPGVLLLAISFAAVILIVVLFSFFHTSATPTAREEIPAVSAQLKTEAATPVPTTIPVVPAAAPVAQTGVPVAAPGAVAGSLVTAATPAIAATPAKPVSRIVINIRETTWMEIRNSSGKAIISQVLNPGEQYNVPNEDGMVLATGNIGGLEFLIDGQPIPPLGNKGDVARGIKLDANAMKPKGRAVAPVAAAAPTAPLAPGASPALTAAQNAAWQSAIRPAAPVTAAPLTATPAAAGTALPQAAAIPGAPVAVTRTPAVTVEPDPVKAAPAPVKKAQPRARRRNADDAYNPYDLPGESSGRSGMYPNDY